MTIVGKILVFLNLVFSLLVGGLVVFAYSARTNWADYAEKEKVARQATESNRDQLLVDIRNAKQQRDDARMTLDQERTTFETDLKREQDEVKRLKALNSELSGNLAAQTLNVESTQIASGVREKEVKELVEILKQRQVRIIELEEEVRDQREEKNRVLVQETFFRARSASLESQLKQAVRDLEQAQNSLRNLGGAVAGADRTAPGTDNPPEGYLEGRVLSVDTSGNFIRVSLGRDAGVKLGHTFEVFRLGAKPKYLGKVQITNVDTRESVARRLKTRADKIRADDRIASRIRVGG